MKAKGKLTPIQLREERAGYTFLLPSLIGTTIFIIIPIVMSLFLGFADWNPMKGLAGLEFVGLENFKEMLGDERVHAALRNNLVYSLSYLRRFNFSDISEQVCIF